MTKELIIIGGPNGAGKSTLAGKTVARSGHPFLNADLIASQLSPSNPEAAKIAGGRAFLDEIKAMVAADVSFVVESTLSGRTLARTLEAARLRGYSIQTTYVFLDSGNECVRRVQERASKGGHTVPEGDIRRRFSRSILNFWHLYRPLSDYWVVVYNSGAQPQEVVFGDQVDMTILDEGLFLRFTDLLDRLSHG